jgi:hypothetical protein
VGITGRVVFYSPRVDAYADAIAAMVQQYRPEKIEIAFLHGNDNPTSPHRGAEQSEFIQELHAKLANIGTLAQPYQEAATTVLVPCSFSQERTSELLVGVDVLDVTTVPKKLSIEIVAASLQTGAPRVCALHWLARFDGKRQLRIGLDPYNYVDLTRLEQTVALRRSYVARARLLLGMGASIFVVAALSISARWFPALEMANEALRAVSVAAGCAGLWLATLGGGK